MTGAFGAPVHFPYRGTTGATGAELPTWPDLRLASSEPKFALKLTQLKVLNMKISEAFPSKYFTGASLTKPVAGTINAVILEGIGQPPKDKAVVYFKGHT